ncbi:hypothetical protein L6164_032121 [Bauhinia variegata]|uniref:Uncharacterized protein n=1 Tax=Bauhinia variegata TaxID=167791 RepID=A0ACB9KN26_BAUVA|nr:hypothetical protein L6164_032121 [Bauhinia variegata]
MKPPRWPPPRSLSIKRASSYPLIIPSCATCLIKTAHAESKFQSQVSSPLHQQKYKTSPWLQPRYTPFSNPNLLKKDMSYNQQPPPVGVPPPQGYPPPEGYAKDAYPPPGYPPQGYPQGGYPPPPPAQGYPPPYAPQYAQPPPQQQQQSSGPGCLEGCLAALCCCCLLDACF